MKYKQCNTFQYNTIFGKTKVKSLKLVKQKSTNSTKNPAKITEERIEKSLVIPLEVLRVEANIISFISA